MLQVLGGLGLRNLGAGLGFPARDWAGSRRWEHQILATRPVVSNKGPSFCLCKKEFPQRQKVANQVFIKRKSAPYMCVDAWVDLERESLGHALVEVWSTSIGHLFRVSLINHFDLTGLQSVFGISQDPPTCVHASLSQSGYYQKGMWVAWP